MNGAERGAIRLVTEFGSGLLLSVFVEGISQGLSPQNQALAALVSMLIGVIGSLILFRVMRFWGDKYIVGWLLGAIFLVWVGWLDFKNTLDFLVYLVVPTLILVTRRSHKSAH